MGWDVHALQVTLSKSITIKLPETIYYDMPNKVLVMQDVGVASKDLKACLLTAEISPNQGAIIGNALAKFASNLHFWGKTQPELRKVLQEHRQATDIYFFCFYGRLAETIDMFEGGVLEEYRDIFRQAAQLMYSEIRNSVEYGIIHGDYWTGNIMVQLDPTDTSVGFRSLYVIDWEVSRVGPAYFDIGQMAAEIFLTSHFRQNPVSLKLLDAFLGGYDGFETMDSRCKTAIHFGTHLVVWPIRAGWCETTPHYQPKEIVECAKIGAQFIKRGIQGDVEWLKASVLGRLFTKNQG